MQYDQKTGAYDISPEDRVKALLYYFGWQGGTIHQLAKETGVDSSTILHGEISSPCNDGFSTIRTCEKDWRVNTLAPKHQGDWSYWAQAIVGYWATGGLG